VAATSAIMLPWPGIGEDRSRARLRFGLIADVHQDIMHDSEQRLRSFIESMRLARPDFILQMGDFCTPIDRNRTFLEIWKSFDGPRYHVLGNHDTDGGFTREQTLAFWNMPARFYSFEAGGVHGEAWQS
jgi:3',5'-cyclic AMP phosphodiesterase CpdA